MAYNPAQWDTLPINDDNLYALLQRATGPSSLTLDPTRFPAPAVDNPTPPASEESSPSPPSIKEREQFARRRGAYEDDHTKRKQDDISDSDDSSYEQPSKYQHRSSDKDSAVSGPRRSSGNKKKSGNPDENRAMKRKEQNRAAQRAFRERKERHVKELEDQVAALEAKSANQDRENENLRDLLGRLQNENLLLKQSAFTFSFPPGGNANSNGSPTTEAPQNSVNGGFGRRPASPKLSSPSSSSSASTPEKTTGEIPESSLFAHPNSSRPHVNSTASTSSGSSPRSEATTSRFQSSPGAFGLGSNLSDFNNNTNSSGLDFFGNGQDLNGLAGGGKTNPINGLTTIAANPMYMSFGDPVLDPMAWASFGPSDYATGTSTSPPGIGANSSEFDLFGLASFGNPGAINVVGGGASGAPSGNTVNATGATGYQGMDDLFGNVQGGGSGVTPSFLDFGGSSSTASSSTGGHTFSSSSPSAVGTLSDVNSSNGAAGSHDDGTGEGCPKTVEDVQRLQNGASPSTFGPPISLPKSNPSSPDASPNSPGNLPQRETNNEACAHARMAALCADLPRTTKKPNQIEIGRAWEKIRQHQGFEECDIDELCNELSAKARCDGSRPVLEEASFNNIVQSLGAMHKKRSNAGTPTTMSAAHPMAALLA